MRNRASSIIHSVVSVLKVCQFDSFQPRSLISPPPPPPAPAGAVASTPLNELRGVEQGWRGDASLKWGGVQSGGTQLRREATTGCALRRRASIRNLVPALLISQSLACFLIALAYGIGKTGV